MLHSASGLPSKPINLCVLLLTGSLLKFAQQYFLQCSCTELGQGFVVFGQVTRCKCKIKDNIFSNVLIHKVRLALSSEFSTAWYNMFALVTASDPSKANESHIDPKFNVLSCAGGP